MNYVAHMHNTKQFSEFVAERGDFLLARGISNLFELLTLDEVHQN